MSTWPSREIRRSSLQNVERAVAVRERDLRLRPAGAADQRDVATPVAVEVAWQACATFAVAAQRCQVAFVYDDAVNDQSPFDAAESIPGQTGRPVSAMSSRCSPAYAAARDRFARAETVDAKFSVGGRDEHLAVRDRRRRVLRVGGNEVVRRVRRARKCGAWAIPDRARVTPEKLQPLAARRHGVDLR